MNEPTANEIKSAQTDGQAFGLTAAFNRRRFIADLLADPRVQIFDRSIVAWLLQSVQQESTAKDSARHEVRDLRNQLASVVQPLPKSKAIVKLAKTVARQADALTDIVQTVDANQSGAPEWEAVKDKHKDIIEAANYGD